MSVKNFKFVSPGVFINEIDNSFRPQKPEVIGPVIIGRSARGPGMLPTKVESYSEFVTIFGDTVPGGGGSGDVYRDGNYQSPMYGTYAAKAFLRSNVAPVTYVRLLGTQNIDQDGSTAAQAGWKTTKAVAQDVTSNGGAYGLWVFESGSTRQTTTGSLAGIWYLNSGSAMYLTGTMLQFGTNGVDTGQTSVTASAGAIIGASSGLFTVMITGSRGVEKIGFSLDDTSDNFMRKKFNTNPQLTSDQGTFYPSASAKDYWLGESFEQQLRWDSLDTSTTLQGLVLAIASGSNSPANMKGQAMTDARAGWFIGQDLGTSAQFQPFNTQKLFRLIGRGHGSWLHKNVKVSISNIRASSTTATDYGTFSVVLRKLQDTDSNVVVMERYDNLTLDPSSPNFIARRIGDQYYQWDTTERRLKLYGDYPNQSKFIRAEMNADVEAGATDAVLLPFGYYGPPQFKDVYGMTNLTTTRGQGIGGLSRAGITTIPAWSGSSYVGEAFVTGSTGIPAGIGGPSAQGPTMVSGSPSIAVAGGHLIMASVSFPVDKLRVSSSDGGLSDVRNAYYGYSTARDQTSTRSDRSAADSHRLLYSGFADDPTSAAIGGVNPYSYIFTLDDIVHKSGTTTFYYQSGSRQGQTNGGAGGYAAGTSYTSSSYKDLLASGVNRFTAPFWGGFDGFDIKVPDPMYNGSMTEGSSTETNSYVYNTWKRAMDTVADPEFINMNLLTAPGLTLESLTTHAVNVCEERADSLAIIDLPNVYIPSSEIYYSDKSNRIGTTPNSAATALKNRQIDSSYGCTFYPWVQARDEATSRLVWIPPSVAMMGVLASSERKSELWFAPAGFNRGGLSEGAAGIPIVGISERLTSRNRDTLYDANINPIASFPSTGIVVFGQKTLQARQSALDRINVRRLVIFMKKQISILSTQILFEQNVRATWNRFTGLIHPFLANVKTRFGITDYKLILDETTTTPDLIDQNVLYAKIMIKPARAIEFIAIDFVIMSTGASFDD